MAYGTLKCDNIVFDNGGTDKLVTVSGLFFSTSGALTVTGTISGGNVTAPTATFTTLTGTTTAGTTATFTSGSFTTLTGTTVTGTTANFVSGVFTTQISGATITGTTVATTTGSFVSLTGTTATFTSGIIASGTAALPSLAILSDPNTGIYSPGADQLAISTNGAGRLFVDGSGNISAGTSPATILGKTVNVYGGSSEGASVVLQANNGSEFCTLFSGPTAADPFALISKSGFKFATASAADATGYSEKLRITSTGALNFVGAGTAGSTQAVSFNGSAPINSLVIDSLGKVGIGTSAPGGTLDVGAVVGAVTAGDLIVATGSTTASVTVGRISTLGGDSTTFKVRNRVNSTVFVVDGPTERVGIGTTGPGYLLTVSGGATSLAANQYLRFGTGLFASGDGTTDNYLFTGSNGLSVRNQADTTERLRIDGSGRLLVGTSSTSHGSAGAFVNRTAGTSNPGASFRGAGWTMFSIATEPALVLSSNISTAGVGTSAETARGGIGFEYISGAEPTRMVIGIVGTPTVSSPLTFWNESERMRFDSAGNLLIGKITTAIGTAGARFTNDGVLNLTRDADTQLATNRLTNDGIAVSFLRAGSPVGNISVTTTATAYNTASDYRLKENVTPITNGITRFQQLKPSQFNFIADPDNTVDGFIAHEAQAVVPECVTGEKDAIDDDGNPVYQGIDQSKLVPLLTAALQEAIGRIETLETEVAALKGA